VGVPALEAAAVSKKGESAARNKERSHANRSRKRLGQLTPEAIVSTAIRIADAEVLDSVSIRRVASELDARPMSFYDHFPSKDDLLGGMADEVIQEILVEQPLPENWREALAAIARQMYAVQIAHPWLVHVFAQRPRFGPNSTKLAKQMAGATASLPLDQADLWAVQGTVNDFVLGHTLRAVAAPSMSDLENVISESDLVDSPALASLPDSLRTRASLERFEFGLQIVLDGVERRFLDANQASSLQKTRPKRSTG
jgi:AcrR family transcriptional regulator